MLELRQLRDAVAGGDSAGAVAAARRALESGTPPLQIVGEGISPAMTAVGRQFEEGDCFVPELLMAARATKEVFAILRPLLAQTGTKPVARVVLGTVKGDMHDIGKNLVGALLEGGGFEVIDLGVDVAPDRFLAAVREQRPEILGLSALLTTTMTAMKATLEALAGAGVRDRVKVMIGGAPVTEGYAQAIGADGYADNAASAVDLARRLIGVEVGLSAAPMVGPAGKEVAE
jgi:5-methyltetrahydrofolate--homocysteine methyltransferase